MAGRRTPICARCLGFLAGNLVAMGWFAIVGLPTLAWTAIGAACLAPAFVDAVAQATTAYRSTNPRRLASGILGGWGQVVMLAGFVANVILR